MKLARFHRAHGDEVRFTKHVERQRGGTDLRSRLWPRRFSLSAPVACSSSSGNSPAAIVGGTHDASDRRTVEDVLGLLTVLALQDDAIVRVKEQGTVLTSRSSN